MSDFKTTHNLPFLVAFTHPDPTAPELAKFRVGTCHGLWGVTESTYLILVVVNDSPGNGHLDDVFEWFENSCARDGKHLAILELWNPDFKKHLLTKRGFVELPGTEHVIKYINPT